MVYIVMLLAAFPFGFIESTKKVLLLPTGVNTTLPSLSESMPVRYIFTFFTSFVMLVFMKVRSMLNSSPALTSFGSRL